VYNPMMRHKMNQPGKSLGVIGLGGLGHMAVKFGKAFGLKVTVLSTSVSKKEEALSVLGADNFVITSDQAQMKVKSQEFLGSMLLSNDISDILIIMFAPYLPLVDFLF